MALMDIDAVEWWEHDQVREALIEAVLLWRRTPGDGRWPFASDGPWHLMSRDLQADYDARGGDLGEVVPRPLPLSRAEVAWRDRVTDWMMLVGALDIAELHRQLASAAPSRRAYLERRIRKREKQAQADRRLLAICLDYHARGWERLPWKRRIMPALGLRRGQAGLERRYSKALREIAEALNTPDFCASNLSRGIM
ncbi:hypothetical protein [Pseudorhodoplanes sp.]|uniref:hypothetical protein n=1 Tax=Pseudorhodoplanes sp. TaxID=1934341 RepID=UPI003918E2EE